MKKKMAKGELKMSNFNNITDPIEQNNLGVKYYRGDGVEKDYTQATHWFKKAAAQGFLHAKIALENLGVK